MSRIFFPNREFASSICSDGRDELKNESLKRAMEIYGEKIDFRPSRAQNF